jgi:uncharacterized protein
MIATGAKASDRTRLTGGLALLLKTDCTLAMQSNLRNMRLVIDTNVLVSIYLYEDARHTPFRAAYTCGANTLLMDANCYEELAHMLRSARFDAIRETRKIDADPLLVRIADESVWIESRDPEDMIALPQCRDPDDQKFLSLAARGGATHLITYDKALLKCRHKVPFQIARPEQIAL